MRARALVLFWLLVVAVSSAHAVPGAPAGGGTPDPVAATSARAAFAPVPVTFGPIAVSPLHADLLREFTTPSGIDEVTPERLFASHELDELQPLTFSPAVLSFTALNEDPNPVIVIAGKRIEPFREEKRSLVKPLTFLFVGLLVTSLFAVFLPRLIAGFTGGGPAQRKGSRR